MKYVSSPPENGKQLKKYWAGFWGENGTKVNTTLPHNSGQHHIGELVYQGELKARLTVPEKVAEAFDVGISPLRDTKGVYIPSHRSRYFFQPLTDIPVKLDAKEQLFEVYLNEIRARFTARGTGNSPCFHLKRSLVALALFGYGNKAVDPSAEAIKIYEGFEHILRIMLPPSLGFQRLKVRVPDVILDTTTGEFSLEAVSGGVAAVIDMAWQIHMYAQLHDEFVVVIDEPEAHLHPALQQRVLPDLLEAFPKAQFVIATHSPFMVTSVPDSNVYVLDYNVDNKVDSTLLDRANKAGSADEVLMDVLGVKSTIPDWARTKIDALVEEFGKGPFTQAAVSELKSKMSTLGMGHLFPEVLATVAEGKP